MEVCTAAEDLPSARERLASWPAMLATPPRLPGLHASPCAVRASARWIERDWVPLLVPGPLLGGRSRKLGHFGASGLREGCIATHVPPSLAPLAGE